MYVCQNFGVRDVRGQIPRSCISDVLPGVYSSTNLPPFTGGQNSILN